MHNVCYVSVLARLLRNAAAQVGAGQVDAGQEAFRLSALIDGLGLQITLSQEGGDADRATGIVDHHLETLGLHGTGA